MRGRRSDLPNKIRPDKSGATFQALVYIKTYLRTRSPAPDSERARRRFPVASSQTVKRRHSFVVARAFGQHTAPELRGTGKVATRLGQAGEVAAGQMAVN